MSTLRNAVKRKEHKERSQPASRRKYGLLEKHKDYVERAKDYHRKEDHLQLLREKASFRNPDEFYFSMEHAKTKNGVHIVDNSRRGGKDAYTEKQLGQFRKTDLQYLQLRTQIERKRMEKLRTSLQAAATTIPAHLLRSGENGQDAAGAEAVAGAPSVNNHIRFDDEGEPEEQDNEDDEMNDELEQDHERSDDKPIPKKLRRLAVELNLRNKRFKRMKEGEKKWK